MMTTPHMRRQRRSIRIGLVLLGLTGVALWLTFKSQTGWPFAPTTTVTAAFENVHSLKVNDDVRQNSKRIGRVSDVRYRGGNAVVTMELSGGRDVHADARAALWDQSALATKFVEFHPGSTDAGPLGDEVIPAERTASSNDLYELLDVFDEKTRKSAQSYLGEAGGGLAAHSKDLHDLLDTAPELLANAGTVSAALASDEANLPALLASANRLTSRFHGRTDEIGSLIAQTDQTMRAFSVDDGRPLRDTITAAPSTLRAVRTALDTLDQPLNDTAQAMSGLRPGAADLGRSTADLRAILRHGAKVAPKMPPVLAKAEPAVGDLTKAVSDARPLAPKLTRAFSDAATPLRVMAPYGPEIGQWMVRGHSFLSQRVAPGVSVARLAVVPAADTVTGGLIGSDNFRQNEYPAPGQADSDRATEGLPSGIPLVGGN